jgi:hypothetical protein
MPCRRPRTPLLRLHLAVCYNAPSERVRSQTPERDMKRTWHAGIIGAVALGIILLSTVFVAAQDRMGRCAAVPLIADDLLGAPDFSDLAPGTPTGVLLPVGWSAAASGVQVGDFTVSGTGRSFQLLGIANHLRTPPGRRATRCVVLRRCAGARRLVFGDTGALRISLARRQRRHPARRLERLAGGAALERTN